MSCKIVRYLSSHHFHQRHCFPPIVSSRVVARKRLRPTTTPSLNHRPFSGHTDGPSSKEDYDEIRTLDQNLQHKILQEQWLINPNLSRYIHAQPLSGMGGENYSVSSDFSVSFLGTGAGGASLQRGSSCSALRWGGGTYLFDVGEGSQLKFQCSNLVTMSIQKIFITHMHADHIFGLPSLLLGLQEGAKQRQKRTTVKIYGPVGLFNYIASSLSLSYAGLKHITVEVFELKGGSRHWVHPGTYKNFGEFQHRSLHRRSISPNQDGTWTLETANEIQSQSDGEKQHHPKNRGLIVSAAQVNHVPKLQCFGFVVQEPKTQLRNVDAQKAIALGIAPSPKYRLLKAGFPVMNDDETRQVHPDEVTNTAMAPRKVAFLGDCMGVPRPMAELCRNADLLVHEATMLESDPRAGSATNGHSTAAMAGIFGEFVQAKVLALNHISPALEDGRDIVMEARSAIQGFTQVQLTYDRMEVEIPRGGFVQSW